jgi:hypothetical protein
MGYRHLRRSLIQVTLHIVHKPELVSFIVGFIVRVSVRQGLPAVVHRVMVPDLIVLHLNPAIILGQLKKCRCESPFDALMKSWDGGIQGISAGGCDIVTHSLFLILIVSVMHQRSFMSQSMPIFHPMGVTDGAPPEAWGTVRVAFRGYPH